MAPYSKMLSSAEPGCIVILIDQSSSMSDPFAGKSGSTKHLACQRAVNRVLYETVIVCSAGAVVKNRCYLGVLGYGARVGSAFQGALAGKELVGVAEVAQHPVRVDTLQQKVDDGAGGLVEIEKKFPVWIEPVAENGTPMAEAMQLATRWTSAWANQHRTSFPPIVINITDGQPNDLPATQAAAADLRRVATEDGELLLLNAHLSEQKGAPIELPDSASELPNQYAQFLFDISSPLPEMMIGKAREVGFNPSPQSRGFVYNADADTMIRLLTFGSNPGLR